MSQDEQRLRRVALKCRERADILEDKIYQHHVTVVLEQRRHLNIDTDERGYYTLGYLQALKDIQKLVSNGDFPTGLNFDGGPRIVRRERDS